MIVHHVVKAVFALRKKKYLSFHRNIFTMTIKCRISYEHRKRFRQRKAVDLY